MADDYFLDSQPDTEITEVNEDELEAPVSNPEFIMVDVKGMVASPGVYELQQEKRIVDAVDMAGGLAKHADATQVNFAARLQDEW
ncbi:SLBB domain-containing protein [Sinobaca sp. H24]|uniref:SLBB domain-containing protein n=1 Tax=Sinobaca sp. H24 TaxID=2923376 RepID=UPI0020799B3D|nr:SLBB domain-containing protein [Sinobaca sp. H24]